MDGWVGTPIAMSPLVYRPPPTLAKRDVMCAYDNSILVNGAYRYGDYQYDAATLPVSLPILNTSMGIVGF